MLNGRVLCFMCDFFVGRFGHKCKAPHARHNLRVSQSDGSTGT